MIGMEMVRGYFPAPLRNNAVFDKLMLKEFIQLMILDFLSASQYARKLCFIGGTNLRLILGIDRFSEDIDFDCKGMNQEEFMKMTDDILAYLKANNFNVEPRDKVNTKLTTFRRNLFFPGLLIDLNLTGHREERFLIKIEAQDQGVSYDPVIADVKGCGFFFPIQVPPKSVLCAMKLTALITRAKGRDFYDSMFLLSQTEPDYNFLKSRKGIANKDDFKAEVKKLLLNVDLTKKAEDFKHLLFNTSASSKILRFGEFVDGL